MREGQHPIFREKPGALHPRFPRPCERVTWPEPLYPPHINLRVERQASDRRKGRPWEVRP